MATPIEVSDMNTSLPAISVIIPANNETDFIGRCLQHLLDQDDACAHAQIIVSANACTDDTVPQAQAFVPKFAARGWQLEVIDSPEPGKLSALNRAEAQALAPALAYLDADVLCDSPLIGQLAVALGVDAPRYASGTFALQRAQTLTSRLYGRFWMDLPFMKSGAVGAGLFAVNRAGRARWGDFPDIISDDTLVRLMFTPEERLQVPARYHWPLVEGFANLVRVRIRQNAGVDQLKALHPEIFKNEAKADVSIPKLALRKPLAFAVYAAVQLRVRFAGKDMAWTRGR